jgi:creatinine amidohydrolase
MTSIDARYLRGADRDRAAALPFSVLPLGSLEYHGDHAPFGTDTTLARGFAERLAARRDCLLFPTLAYAFIPRLTLDHGPGASVAPDVYLAHLTQVLRGLLSFGPRRILVLNGHSENQHAARLAAEALHAAEPDVSAAIVNWWKLADTPWRDDLADPWHEGGGHGHGGPLEISVAGAFDPAGVRAPADDSADVPYEAPWWRGAAQVVGRGQAPEGFAGYHGRVSAIDLERGRRIADQVAGELVRFVDDWLARVDAEGTDGAGGTDETDGVDRAD